MNDVILLCKQDRFSQAAAQVARALLGTGVVVLSGRSGDAMPAALAAARAPLVLSFLSPWIVPASVLRRAETALNWHPASRDYPGMGCYNFALYDEAAEYGAVCHYMAEKVDTGPIVEERRFPLFASDSVETLKLRTLITLLAMFHDTLCALARGGKPAVSSLKWSRQPYTRRQLNELARLDQSMPADELRRRIRATTYPGYPAPHLEIDGQTFFAPVPDREPLA